MATTDPATLVRSLRTAAGLSQHELAARAGMAQSAISNYESGHKVPSLATLNRLASAVGASLDLSVKPVGSTDKVTLTALRRHRQAIEASCLRHGASNPRVFGSLAKGRARPGSDIDLLVDLEPGRTLFDVAALHDDLAELLGHEVDVLTSGAVRGRLAHIADEAVPL
ncbi:MAG TPA: helix-turn-helix domain-containing protein [Ilumatobacteraceae bacterium]|nr:helix-turn-helix domain-containing protein [Ilumatobacteraceae bacterium]